MKIKYRISGWWCLSKYYTLAVESFLSVREMYGVEMKDNNPDLQPKQPKLFRRNCVPFSYLVAILLATLLLPASQAEYPAEEWFLIEGGDIHPSEATVDVGDILYISNMDQVAHTVFIAPLPGEQGVLNGETEICQIESGTYCRVLLSPDDWGETKAIIRIASTGEQSVLNISNIFYSSAAGAHGTNGDVGLPPMDYKFNSENEVEEGEPSPPSAGSAPAWGPIFLLFIVTVSLLHYLFVRRKDRASNAIVGTSRPVFLALFVLLAAPVAPAVAEWCWVYADFEPAMNPQEWECNSPPITPTAAADPSDLSLQKILDEHMNWHCTNTQSNPGYGEQFLVYHKQEIYAFDQFRENMGLEHIEIWDPNTFAPGPDYNPMPWGIPGCGLGDLDANGECPITNPGVPPDLAGGLGFGECVDGTGRSGDGLDDSTFVPCATCMLLPDAYRWPDLDTIPSADILGAGLDSGFHGSFHGGIRNSYDADGNRCKDSWPTSTAPRDAMFWRAHKALDEVHHEWLSYQPADVVVLLDRSGSMLGLADPADPSSASKMDAAKSAASFFSDVIENNVGHSVGVLTFSSTPSSVAEVPLDEADEDSAAIVEQALSSVQAGGATGIGQALISAQDVLNQGSNDRKAILLLTDGMENVCPRVQDPYGTCDAAEYVDADGNALNDLVTDALGDTQVCAVGLGGENSLDGLMLRNLTERQGGIYRQGVGELQLMEFFLRCFSTIFNFQEVIDPVEVLLASENESAPLAVMDSLSDTITFVLAWESGASSLSLSINTPSGNQLDLSHRDVESSSGPNWQIVRVPVGIEGAGQGEWRASAIRTQASQLDQNYFLDVLSGGGPQLEYEQSRVNTQTGDTLRVKLRIPLPTIPIGGFDSVDARVTITSPNESIGALLSQHGLSNLSDARTELGPVEATLKQIWNGTGGVMNKNTATYQLYDDGTHGDLFANNHYWSAVLPVPARFEGHYELYFQVNITDKQTTLHRELASTLYVSPGIDPDSSTIQVSQGSTNGNGDHVYNITVTPQDRIGNPIGPGRPHLFGVELGSGVNMADSNDVKFMDLLNGQYRLSVILSGDAKGIDAGVKLTQNGRQLYFLNLETGEQQKGVVMEHSTLPHVHLNSKNSVPPELQWKLQSTDDKISPGDSVFIEVDASILYAVNFRMNLDFEGVKIIGTDKEAAALDGNNIVSTKQNDFVIEVQVPEDSKEGDSFKLMARYGTVDGDDDSMDDLGSLTIEVGQRVSGGGGGLPGWSTALLVTSLVAAGIVVERKRMTMGTIQPSSVNGEEPPANG